ncbi:MAG TPA: hypothetical protein VF463_02455 [Sphingobium sp.]
MARARTRQPGLPVRRKERTALTPAAAGGATDAVLVEVRAI